MKFEDHNKEEDGNGSGGTGARRGSRGARICEASEHDSDNCEVMLCFHAFTFEIYTMVSSCDVSGLTRLHRHPGHRVVALNHLHRTFCGHDPCRLLLLVVAWPPTCDLV